MKSQRKTRIACLILSFMTLLILSGTFGAAAQQGDDGQLQLGGQIYAENCAVCHGLNGEGRVGATLAKDWPSIRPDLATQATVAEGVPGTAMPAWSQQNGGPLTDEEIDAVTTFILSWQTGGAPEITPRATATHHPPISPVPEVEGDPTEGARLYHENCAVCHGSDGQGRIGATLSKNWSSIRPDLEIRSTIARGVEGTVMPAWSQEQGGPLPEKEIDDIVAYIMSWSAPVEAVTSTPEVPTVSRWAGWAGVILTISLFVIIVVVVLVLQKRKS
jgi:mono/diheme cytochrome c family protein